MFTLFLGKISADTRSPAVHTRRSAIPEWQRKCARNGSERGHPVRNPRTFLGALFESLVTLSLRVCAQAGDAAVRHFRTHRGDHEADLIIERDDGRIVAVEVKLANCLRRDG
ncbi:MAG: DUF4143 domain-containing protein [Actinomycetota bacterium]